MRLAVKNKSTNGDFIRTSVDSVRTIGRFECTDIFSAHLCGISARSDKLSSAYTKVSHIHTEVSHIYTEFQCVRIFSPHIYAESTHVRTGFHPHIRNFHAYVQNSCFHKKMRFSQKNNIFSFQN